MSSSTSDRSSASSVPTFGIKGPLPTQHTDIDPSITVTGQEQTIAELAPAVKSVFDLHTHQLDVLRHDVNRLNSRMSTRFDNIDARLDGMDTKFKNIESQITKLDTKIDDSVAGLQNLIKANQTHTELMIKQILQELTTGPAHLHTTPNAAPSVVVDDVDGQRVIDAAHDEMRTELNKSSRRIQSIYNSWLRPLRLGRPLSRSTSDLREIS